MIVTIRIPDDTVKILTCSYDEEGFYEKDPVPVPITHIINVERENAK